MPDRYSVRISNVNGTPHAHHINRLRWLERESGMAESSHETARAVLDYARANGSALVACAHESTAERFAALAHERNEDSTYLFDVELTRVQLPDLDAPVAKLHAPDLTRTKRTSVLRAAAELRSAHSLTEPNSAEEAMVNVALAAVEQLYQSMRALDS